MQDLIICRFDKDGTIIFFKGTWESNFLVDANWTIFEANATEFPVPRALDMLMIMNTIDSMNCWLRPKRDSIKSA